MNKIRVAVLFGGRSAEHEVSLRSAQNVIQFLDPARFDIVPIGIDPEGNWFLGQEIFTKSLAENSVSKLSNSTWFTPEWVGKPTKQMDVNMAPLATSDRYFDVVFPAVHGTLCEDGTLQGLLELANLPYVGCGVLSSAIGMDKDISKRLAILADIKVPAYVVLRHTEWQANKEASLKTVSETLSLPVFVKPANTGSSIGVNKANTREQLMAAIEEAFRFDTKIVIEKALNMLELEVAVLQSLEANAEPIASVVGQIIPSEKHGFYSYDAKYVDEHGAQLLIPAAIPEEVQKAAQTMAKKIFQVLECEGMARVDLFYNLEDQQIYFNEVNTLPGFTQISMYPKLMHASGLSYSDLLTHLIQLAIKRHQHKSQLKRSYSG